MKTASRIALTLLLLVIFAGTTFAQTSAAATPVKKAGTTMATQGKFVDKNNNGICDNHESKTPGTPGKNFVDKNGDGKCDLCGSAGPCKGAGNCPGKGPGCAKSCGQGAGKGNCGGAGYQHRNGSCCVSGTKK
ncbi:MAG TPA: hypothetical protein PKG48_03590 [Bacteroidales bacterium]|nr:hypothetical protein [Bacteroidales bacterium]HPS61966.1 hypothetical protein [Bacteroidales bacterium]